MTGQPDHDPRYDALARQCERSAPVRVTALEYYGGRDEPPQSRVPKATQFFIGLLMPIGYGIAVAATQGIERGFLFYGLTHLVVILGIAVLVRLRLRWKAFIPGVLTIVLLAPVGIFVLCCIALSHI